jgi:diguanylate cyclase (GGDEF)-like protein
MAGALSYAFLRPDTISASIWYEVVGAAAVVVMFAAIRRHKPDRPLPWYLLFASISCSVLGDGIYAYLETYAGDTPFPSIADAFYLMSYPLSAAGLLLIVRARVGRRDRSGLLDAAVVATAIGLLTWVFLIRPIAGQYGTAELDQLVALAYPVGDVLLIAMTARLLASPARRSPAYVMLVLAQAALLPPDVSFNVTSATNTSFDWLDWLWLVSYVLSAASAVHPSMRRLQEPVPAEPESMSRLRLGLLTAMSLLAPAVLAFEGLRHPHEIDWAAVAVGSTVLFLLVLARMRGLLSRLRSQAEQLERLAHADGLTGVPNRRAWDEALIRETAAARGSGLLLVVAIIDLDHFKNFNDTNGHQAGDVLLQEAAAAWSAELRAADLLARYGGEEFGILMTGLPAAEAHAVVDRLRAVTPRGQTFSAGVAEWDGSQRPEELVHRADQALYRAKEAGRDRVVLDADPPIEVRVNGAAAE